MSDQWFYRIKGQQFGPVAFDIIQTLATTGTIAPDDEIRPADSANWLLACAATELRETNRRPMTGLAVDRRMARDEWFCRGSAGDFGPLKLVDLIRMAAEGDLKPDEEIKSTANDYWKQIRSYGRLTQLLPFDHEPVGPEFSDLTTLLKRVSTLEQNLDKLRNPSKVNPTVRQIPHPSADFDSDLSGNVALDNQPEVLLFPGLHSLSRELDETELGCTASSCDCEIDDETEPQCPSVIAMPAVSGHENLTTLNNLASPPMIGAENAVFRATDGRREIEPSLNTPQWTGWIDGSEFGPVGYAELLSWAVTGRLSPTDFVRRGAEGAFVPAVNVPCLFTVQAAANSLSRRTFPGMGAGIASETSAEKMVEIKSANERPAMTNDRLGIDSLGPFPTDQDNGDLRSIIPLTGVNPLQEQMNSTQASIVGNLTRDTTSVGISAMLTIGLVILGWVASL
jgi:hypothetical protein